MDDSMLIAGQGKELISALSAEAEKRGIKTILAVIPGQNDGSRPGARDGSSATPVWNPGSPVSARSLVLAAENRIGTLGAAIVVCSAPNEAETRDFSPAGIDAIVNSHIKSYMFLSRELIRYFQQKKRGTLALVLLETPPQGLLSASVFGAFRGFSDSLLERSNTEHLRMASFLCDEKNPPPASEYAAYILKTLAENKKIDRSRFKFAKFMHGFGSRL
jgi:NAD(P)-dependent dehydrogenase (short-subunit alcohol dehydrogenase family)